jgi:hypothetical protein
VAEDAGSFVDAYTEISETQTMTLEPRYLPISSGTQSSGSKAVTASTSKTKIDAVFPRGGPEKRARRTEEDDRAGYGRSYAHLQQQEEPHDQESLVLWVAGNSIFVVIERRIGSMTGYTTISLQEEHVGPQAVLLGLRAVLLSSFLRTMSDMTPMLTLKGVF